MRKDLVQIINYFLKNSFSLKIINTTTNSFDPELIAQSVRKISKLGTKTFILGISLDGFKELHNFIRGVDAFDKAIELFKLTKSIKGVNVIFSYTISKYNVGRFNQTLNEVKAKIPNITLLDFNFNSYGTSPIYYKNQSNECSPQEKQAISHELLCLSKQKKKQNADSPIEQVMNRYLELAPIYLKKGHCPIRCSSIRSSIFMDPYGEIFPCITWNNSLGNIRNSGYSISRILTNELSKETQTKIETRECPGCWTPCEAYPAIIDESLSFNNDNY